VNGDSKPSAGDPAQHVTRVYDSHKGNSSLTAKLSILLLLFGNYQLVFS